MRVRVTNLHHEMVMVDELRGATGTTQHPLLVGATLYLEEPGPVTRHLQETGRIELQSEEPRLPVQVALQAEVQAQRLRKKLRVKAAPLPLVPPSRPTLKTDEPRHEAEDADTALRAPAGTPEIQED